VSGQIAGMGIGLATARQVVEQHGGTIAVDSEEGRGSTFTVRLPLGPDETAPPGDDTPGPAGEPVRPEAGHGQVPDLAWEGGVA
jgi:hypothetical protein